MAEKRIPFFTQAAILDSYMKMKDSASIAPVADVISRKLRENEDLYRYFFLHKPSPQWAPELAIRGFFQKAPDPLHQENKIEFPQWLEQEYLISVAQAVPDVVLHHVRSIEGHVVYRDRAIAALAATQSEVIESALTTVFDWARQTEESTTPMRHLLNLCQLIGPLAAGRSDAAFHVFEVISKVYPPSRDEHEWFRDAKPAFPLEMFYPSVTLKDQVESLFRLDPVRTIGLLELRLREVLRIEADARGWMEYEQYSGWRYTIEDSGSLDSKSYRDSLLVHLRDSLTMLSEMEPVAVRPVLERFLADPGEIFNRLAFYLLAKAPDTFSEIVSHTLAHHSNLDNSGIRIEYFDLLRVGVGVLNSIQQQQLTKLILLGPSQEKLQSITGRHDDEPESERKVRIQEYSERWILDRLWMLQDILDDPSRSAFDALLKKYGKPSNPTGRMNFGRSFVIHDVSPTTVEELRRYSPEELVSYLESWAPRPRNAMNETESFAALAADVAQLLFSDMPKYEARVLEIASIHASFASAFVTAGRSLEPQKDDFLDLRLAVAGELLREDSIRTALEETPTGRWVNFRFSLGKVLRNIITDWNFALSPGQMSQVKSLVITLCYDPDPDLESDRPGENWFGHNDPLTTAINHVRSEAVHSLILLANRIASENEDFEITHSNRKLDPDISKCLDEKVSRKFEQSLAVHSVFGLELALLFWLDREWVVRKLSEIFPPRDEKDEDAIKFYIAAWDCWVINNSIPAELYELLHEQYERAIENASNGYLTRTFNPVRGLANHVLLYFQEGDFELDSPVGRSSLMAQFFEKALPDQRAEATWALSQRTHENKGEWSRALMLWQWRFEMASRSNFSLEFSGEMDGFSNLLLAAPSSESIVSLWPLLQGFLHYLQGSRQWSRIWHNLQEFLAKEVDRFPEEVIRYYTLMHDRLDGPRFYYEDKAKVIIESAARNPKSRVLALELIDNMSRRGNYNFRYLEDEIVDQG